MIIDINLTQKDWLKYSAFVQRRVLKQTKSYSNSFLVNLVVWFIIVFIFVLLFQITDEFHWQTAICVSTIFLIATGLFILNLHRLRKAVMPSEDGIFVGTHHFVFDEKGIHSEGRGYKCFYDWTAVKSIEHANGIVLIFIDNASAFIFPEREISDAHSHVSPHKP